MDKPELIAMNGREVLKYLIDRIEKKLDASGEFAEHVTFPWWKYSFEVKLLSYPKQDIDVDLNVVAQGQETIGEIALTGHEVVHTVEVEESETIDTPDKARIDSDQPINVPASGPGGNTIDKQVLVPKREHKHKGNK